MDFNQIGGELAKRPWLIAGVVIVVLFLSRNKGGTGGFNYDAMLQSQQIATQGNLQSGQTYAQMYAVDAARNSAYVDAQKEVILGQQSLTALDKTLTTQMRIKAMDSQQVASDSSNSYIMGMVSNLMSHQERVGDLKIQAAQVNNSYDLGIRSLNNDAASISNDLITSLTDLGNQAKALDINSDLTKFSLPFEERMHQDDNATTRDLAYRMQKIAKYQAKSSLFGSIIGSVTGLLSKGIDAGAMTKMGV